MHDSPFRDDVAALQSALEELQRHNEELSDENARLRAEIERLRESTPENAAAFARRLQEEIDELRARVKELEPLKQRVAQYERAERLPANEDLLQFFEKVFRKIFRD